MSMTLTHQIAQTTKTVVQTSPILWIAAAGMLIFVILGCTLPPASFYVDAAQIEAPLIGP